MQLSASYLTLSLSSLILKGCWKDENIYFVYIQHWTGAQAFPFSSPCIEVYNLTHCVGLKNLTHNHTDTHTLETIKYTHFDIVSRIWLKLGNAEIEDINMPVLTVHGLNPHSRDGIRWEEKKVQHLSGHHDSPAPPHTGHICAQHEGSRNHTQTTCHTWIQIPANPTTRQWPYLPLEMPVFIKAKYPAAPEPTGSTKKSPPPLWPQSHLTWRFSSLKITGVKTLRPSLGK